LTFKPIPATVDRSTFINERPSYHEVDYE